MRKWAAMAMALVVLSAPAAAEAKRASANVAKRAAVEVARGVYLDVTEATDYGRGTCRRQGAHKVWCWSWIENDYDYDGYFNESCWWKTVTVRGHRSGRYAFRAPESSFYCDGEAEAGEDDDEYDYLDDDFYDYKLKRAVGKVALR